MNLQGKNVIAIGERDGVQGEVIRDVATALGANVVYTITQCFVWTSAGAMDLDDQATIQQVVERVGTDDLVVLLGSPNPESAELYAATVTMGDPTFAGPLAGIPLGLPVYHVLEPDIADQLPPETYAEQLQMAALTLETDAIFDVVRRIRAETQPVAGA